MTSFAPSRPYALLAPAALDLLLSLQEGPTYLRLLCLLRAGVLTGLVFNPRWRKRGVYLAVIGLGSVMACVWETCKSALYKQPSPGGPGDGGDEGGSEGGGWDEWYGPEASAAYLAETCVLALGEILLYTLLLRLTPRFVPPRPPPSASQWPLTPETPSPPRAAWFGSLRANAPSRPSPLALSPDEAYAPDDAYPPSPRHGTSPSPERALAAPPGPVRSFSNGSGSRKERLASPTSPATDNDNDEEEEDGDERGDLLAPLRRESFVDLPPHTQLDEVDDGYDSSASESSIIDMPRRRMQPLDAESISEVAENASASVISVVAGIGGIVRRSASRSLPGTSPGYGTFDVA